MEGKEEEERRGEERRKRVKGREGREGGREGRVGREEGNKHTHTLAHMRDNAENGLWVSTTTHSIVSYTIDKPE